MRPLSVAAALLAGFLLAGQSPIGSFPPGTFSNIAALSGGAPPAGMVTPLLMSSAGSLSNSSVNYGSFGGGPGGSWTTGAGGRTQPMPTAGTISTLRARFPTAVAGGTTYDVMLMLNGGTTLLTCQITSASTECSDNVNSIAIALGDLVEWRVTPTGTPNAQSAVQISALFTSTTAGQSFLFAPGSSTPSTSAPNYSTFGGARVWNATESIVSSVVSAPGTISHLYVVTGAAPGAARSYTLEIYKNGASTGVTCQVAGAAATTCNDPTNTVAIAAGDLISLRSDPAGTPAAASIRASVRFTPTTPGHALIFSNSTSVPSATVSNYGTIASGSNAGSSDAGAFAIAPTGMTVRNLYVSQDVAPGGGFTRSVVLRKGTGGGQTNSSLTCTVATAATDCNDTSNSYAAASGEFLNWQTNVSGANAALAAFKVGMTVTVP